MTDGIRSEARRGVYVYLWLPPVEIDWDDYAGLKQTVALNAAASLFTPGSHKSQGHAMIRFKHYRGLTQRLCGKTTRDRMTPTEALWRDAFLEDRTPSGGVEALVRHGSPARYQTLRELLQEVGEAKGRLQKWFFPAAPEQAAAGVRWADAGATGGDWPQGPLWGFGRGCTNWVHGALDAAGLLGDALEGYERVHVHDAVWRAGGASLLARRPWRRKRRREWVHPVDFLTPRLFRKVLRRAGFEGGDL